MSCNCSSSFLSVHFQPRSHHKLKPGKQQASLFTNSSTARTKRLQLRRPNVLNCIAASNVLPVTYAPRGDIKVLLQSSVILLIMYVIANFVAPYFISKYYEAEDKKPQEKDPSDS